MYRQQRSGGILTIVFIGLLGLAIGVGYLAYDNGWFSPQAAPTPTAVPTQAQAPDGTAEAIASPTVPPVQEVTHGARFYAPTAGIAGDIVQSYLDGTSWDVSQLGPNVGHLQGTAWMNDTGNIVLAGHVELSDGRQGIFARLSELQIGDSISLSQDGQEHLYQVKQKFTTEPTDMSVVYPSETNRLTLITCSDYDFFQDTYLERLVVIADRVS